MWTLCWKPKTAYCLVLDNCKESSKMVAHYNKMSVTNKFSPESTACTFTHRVSNKWTYRVLFLNSWLGRCVTIYWYCLRVREIRLSLARHFVRWTSSPSPDILTGDFIAKCPANIKLIAAQLFIGYCPWNALAGRFVQRDQAPSPDIFKIRRTCVLWLSEYLCFSV